MKTITCGTLMEIKYKPIINFKVPAGGKVTLTLTDRDGKKYKIPKYSEKGCVLTFDISRYEERTVKVNVFNEIGFNIFEIEEKQMWS